MKNVLGRAVEKTYPTLALLNAGGATPFALETQSVIETLQFALTGTLTNAGYATAPVKRVEGIENLIRTLDLTGTGKLSGMPADTFTSVDAAYLAYQTRCLETTAPDRIDAGTANATYNFRSTWNKYFGLKRHMGRYTDGFLDARALATFVCTLNWRDVNALIQPNTGTGGGTSTLSAVQVQVHSVEWQGGDILDRRAYLKQTQRNQDLSNLTGLNVRFTGSPIGSFMTKQTFKTMAGDTNYADPTNSILATSQQSKGAFIRTQLNGILDILNISATALQSRMKVDYSLESLPAGYYTMEYSRNRTLEGDVNLTAPGCLLDNYLDLTTASGVTNTLQITDERVVIRRQ